MTLFQWLCFFSKLLYSWDRSYY